MLYVYIFYSVSLSTLVWVPIKPKSNLNTKKIFFLYKMKTRQIDGFILKYWYCYYYYTNIRMNVHEPAICIYKFSNNLKHNIIHQKRKTELTWNTRWRWWQIHIIIIVFELLLWKQLDRTKPVYMYILTDSWINITVCVSFRLDNKELIRIRCDYE